jgi:hypothetical protein
MGCVENALFFGPTSDVILVHASFGGLVITTFSMLAIVEELSFVPPGGGGNSLVEKGTKCNNVGISKGYESVHI